MICRARGKCAGGLVRDAPALRDSHAGLLTRATVRCMWDVEGQPQLLTRAARCMGQQRFRRTVGSAAFATPGNERSLIACNSAAGVERRQKPQTWRSILSPHTGGHRQPETVSRSVARSEAPCEERRHAQADRADRLSKGRCGRWERRAPKTGMGRRKLWCGECMREQNVVGTTWWYSK